MSGSNDLNLNASAFDPANMSPETAKLNTMIETMFVKGPTWMEVGAAKYRSMRALGQTALPAPVLLPDAEDIPIPSRDTGRTIPVRKIVPKDSASKGIFLHIHGGGFVIGGHQEQDISLARYATTHSLTVLSIGYRLAPEHPFPAPLEDCIDVAHHLVDNDSHGPILFMGGESAGANLAVVTALHLHVSRPSFTLLGLVLPFGVYDGTMNLPSIAGNTRPLLLNEEVMQAFMDAYTPSYTIAQIRDPRISPLYADLHGLAAKKKLPPAVMVVGTADPLVDDTLMMGMKWQAAGGEAFVKVYAGGAHGFTAFPAAVGEEARVEILDWMGKKLEGL
ncbi:hypothetical protein BT63DRAFT_430286 [Microthyrium microscopicum]|uniref:Alpha/beta hydrolase fold-3 domain-containing protein n=1 Tax=Microthyrium microscopicum TaxID=703497 RepID=A0A6A6TVF4_9PEZI|nr:hypothetical protein BT63DRAFT_430286 [Microthyrium microscopicum]